MNSEQKQANKQMPPDVTQAVSGIIKFFEAAEKDFLESKKQKEMKKDRDDEKELSV